MKPTEYLVCAAVVIVFGIGAILYMIAYERASMELQDYHARVENLELRETE